MLAASTGKILRFVCDRVAEGLRDGWAATPLPGRAALLAREAIETWVAEHYPAAALERRGERPERVALLIFTPPSTHRVECWGQGCGEELRVDAHAQHSWVVVTHVCAGAPCGRPTDLSPWGLKRVDEIADGGVQIALWTGTRAPDGCPDCIPVPKETPR